MASGSSGRATAGYDFGTDDILCSYDDFNNQESSNGALSDSGIRSNSGKDFHKNRMSRSSLFPAPIYGQQDESLSQEVIASVEKSMKTYTENIMRFLEGISSRLSQLELYCYNLDKAIGEMRSDLGRDHGEADTKLKSLERNLQEVHRSVQILRDKQELAETQKELAKIQLAQKESSSESHSQSNEERPPSSDQKKTDNTSDTHGQQLALALPHQVPPPQQPIPSSSQAPPQNLPPQPQSYYFPPNQLPALPSNTQHPQNQYIPPDPRYQTPQVQDLARVAPQQAPSPANPTPPVQAVPQYQLQWTQQVPAQQVPPAPQTSMPPQMRPQSPSVYPPYTQPQPTNAPLPDSHPSSMPMQIPFPGVPQAGPSHADPMPYGYGGAGRTSQPQQQPPPQQLKAAYGPQPGDGYGSNGPNPPYMMYDSEGGRPYHTAHQPHFPQGGYLPTSPFPNQPQGGPNQLAQNHPYRELMEKLASMGFRGDHVASVIQRMEESGQPIDFNSVLDRLNVHTSGGSQGGWSR